MRRATDREVWPQLSGVCSYTLFYAGAAIVHAAAAFVLARWMLVPRRVWAATTACFTFGMTAGAKALWDVTHGIPLRALLSPAHYLESGLWGGPLVVLVLATPLAARLCRDARLGADYVACSMPLPLAVAKIGCFACGCCYGRPTTLPWAASFPNGPSGVHPTQLYEAASLLATAVWLHAIARRPRARGTLMAWFLALYGVTRGLIEALRGDERVTFAGISASQAVALALILPSALFLLRAARRPAIA